MATKKKLTVQGHHICYEDWNHKEWVVKLYQHEHFYLTRLGRITKNISQGFLDALQVFVDRHRRTAKDLERGTKDVEKD